MTTHNKCVNKISTALLQAQWQLATAESCTGGLIAAACTEIPGSSRWFERGFITYSNASKSELLGVDSHIIALNGAVSEPVALAMAQGALRHSHADIALSVTGIAGPGGASAEKPVGTIWFAWVTRQQHWTECCHFTGTRRQVRQQTVAHSLQKLYALISDNLDITKEGDNHAKKS
jgi:nicotinamide-nucleotide amidase